MAGKGTKNNQQNTQGDAQTEQAVQTKPLDFDVRIHSIKPNESIKGTASVNINGAFAIRGVKIIEGSNGLFVSMPSYKVGNEYKDICFPITQECRKRLNDAVIGAYEQALTQSQSSMATHKKVCGISESLKKRFLENGMPREVLNKITGGGASVC